MRKFSFLVLALAGSCPLWARESLLLDSGWRFTLGDADGAQNVKFGEHSDKFWQTVSAPHCWGWEDAGRAGQGRAGQGREYRPVHLVVTGPENFTLTDHGSPGVA